MNARAGLFGLVLVAAALGCKEPNPRCVANADCAFGKICSLDHYCISPDGGPGGRGGSQGGAGAAAGSHGGAGGNAFSCATAGCHGAMPICDLDAGACRGCNKEGASACSGLDAGTNVCVTDLDAGAPAGTCVGCLTNANCDGDTPICDHASHACTACAADADCKDAGPGICVGDGHCAASGEVVFLDESAASCPSADGTAAKPYCTFAQATGALIQNRPILVILGGTKEQLSLAPTTVQPIIIGRPNTSGDPGSIPATNATAIAVSSGTVLIRDLLVNLGSSKASKGVVASGSAMVTLLRVTVNLTNGLGVDAETGSTLDMKSCTVTNNLGGGILLNEASFDIENTTVTGNGPGTVLGASTLGGILVNNATAVTGTTTISSTTIANNGGPGLVCAAPITGTNVLAVNNSSGNVSCSGVTTCADAGPGCGAQP